MRLVLVLLSMLAAPVLAEDVAVDAAPGAAAPVAAMPVVEACAPARFKPVRGDDGAIIGHTVSFDSEPVLALIAEGCGYLRLGCNTCYVEPGDCDEGEECPPQVSCSAKRCYSMGAARPSCTSRMARFGCLDPEFTGTAD